MMTAGEQTQALEGKLRSRQSAGLQNPQSQLDFEEIL
jgi:hypothetical protein